MIITIAGFIHAIRYTPHSKPIYGFAQCEMQQHGYMTVMPYALEVDIPSDFNIAAAEIAALEAKRRAALDEYTSKVAEINDRISKLQAIECVSTGAV